MRRALAIVVALMLLAVLANAEQQIDVTKYLKGLQNAFDNETLGKAVGFLVFIAPSILFFVEAAREAIPMPRPTTLFGALLTFGLCILIFLLLTSFGCYIMRDLPPTGFVNGTRSYCVVVTLVTGGGG